MAPGSNYQSDKRRVFIGLVYLILSSLALAGGVGVIYATQPGIGLYPDSVVYIAAARSLLAGKGLLSFGPDGNWVPLTHFPPLFPLLLATSRLWGQDPIDGARWVAAFSFTATIFLTGLMLMKLRPLSHGLPVLGGFLVLAAGALLPVYLVCYSEAVFIPLVLAGAYLLIRYIEDKRAWRLTLFSACLGLALLTRYAGAAFVLAAGVCLWIFYPAPLKERLKVCVLMAGISALPTAIWLARNLVLAGGGTDRAFVLHPPGWPQIDQIGRTLASWLIPSELGIASADLIGWLLAVLFACGVGFYLWKRLPRLKTDGPVGPIPGPLLVSVLGTFILVYFLFLLVSITFFDALTEFDARILSPVYIPTIIILLVIGSEFWEKSVRKASVRLPALMALVVCLTLFPIRGLMLVINSHVFGWGYANISWRDSALMQRVNDIPLDQPVITNELDGVYILTGRLALPVPEKIDPTTLMANPRYLANLESLQEVLQKEQGWVAWFDETTWYIPSRAEIEQAWPLSLVVDTGDGWLYRAAPAH